MSCSGFDTWEEAQTWFDTYAPHYGDVAYMDINGNGVACEKLLPEGVTVADVLAATTTTSTTIQPTTTTRRATTTTRPRAATTTRPRSSSPFTPAEMQYLNDALFFLGGSSGGFYHDGVDTTEDGRADTTWDDPSVRTIVADAHEAIRQGRSLCRNIDSLTADLGLTADEVLRFAYENGYFTDVDYLSGTLAVEHLCSGLTDREKACADNWETISYAEMRLMKQDRSIDGIFDWSEGYWVSYDKIMDIC